MNAEILRTPVINGKPIQFVATADFNNKYGGLEMVVYIRTVLQVIQKYPVDMLVFEMTDENHMQVRLAGYDMRDDTLYEQTIATTFKSLPTDTFWLKIDDYGDKYVGTFLFPYEY